MRGVLVPSLLAAMLAAPSAFGLDAGRRLTQHVLESWGTSEGLPQSSVRALAQSADGYLWLGTAQGVSRFDGVRFTVFDPSNTPAMTSGEVRGLAVGHDGSVWVSTAGGLVRERHGQWTAVTSEDIPAAPTGPLLVDRGGVLWVATARGLARLRGEDWSLLGVSDGLPEEAVRCLRQDSEGTVWAGTRKGLVRIREGRPSVLRRADGLPDDDVYSLASGRDGALWIGTGRGVVRLKEGRFESFDAGTALGARPIWSLFEDSQGSLWLGSFGLHRYAGGRMETLTLDGGIPADNPVAFIEDREGSLWIGTYSGGLVRLRDADATTFTRHEGLPRENTTVVYEDRAGVIWIGTYGGGLHRLTGGEPRTFTTRDGLESDNVYALAEDAAGRLWVGTFGGGLHVLAGRRLQPYPLVTERSIFALYADRRGRLWVGGDRGLGVLDSGRFTLIPPPDPRWRTIRVIIEDRSGAIWAGTASGLWRFAAGDIARPTRVDALVGDDVHALREDAAGALWVGTRRGLSLLKDGRWVRFTTAQGLAENTVFQILEDEQDHLWMSGYGGVSRIARRDLEAVALGKRQAVEPRVFDALDGMKTRECVGGSQPAGCHARNGDVWFPTLRGVVRFTPRALHRNRVPPVVLVDQATVNGVPAADGVPVRAGDGRVEVRYLATSLRIPQRVRFRYRLDGYDDDWVDAGGRRIAYYTSLPPGRYAFRVTAANDSGLWGTDEASFRFELTPPFRATTTFRILLFLTLALLLVMAHRLRMRAVVRRQRALALAVAEERLRLSRDLHDSVIQLLFSLTLNAQSLGSAWRRSPPEGERLVEKLVEMARAALVEMRALVAALRPSAGHDEPTTGDEGDALGGPFVREHGLPAGLRRYAQMIADPHLEVEIQEDGYRAGNPRAEQQLFHLVQEALNNVVRHARASRVRLAFATDQRTGTLTVRIEDDGAGFRRVPGGTPPGQGLGIMEERAASLGGRLEVTSAVSGGTLVEIVVPRWTAVPTPADLPGAE